MIRSRHSTCNEQETTTPGTHTYYVAQPLPQRYPLALHQRPERAGFPPPPLLSLTRSQIATAPSAGVYSQPHPLCPTYTSQSLHEVLDISFATLCLGDYAHRRRSETRASYNDSTKIKNKKQSSSIRFFALPFHRQHGFPRRRSLRQSLRPRRGRGRRPGLRPPLPTRP